MSQNPKNLSPMPRRQFCLPEIKEDDKPLRPLKHGSALQPPVKSPKPKPPIPLPRRQLSPQDKTEEDKLEMKSSEHLPPVPRRQFSLPDKTEENGSLRPRSAPQSPTNSPEGSVVRSTPPPVLPKKWTVKKAETGNVYMEKVKVIHEESIPNQMSDNDNETLDFSSLLEWWKEKKSWDSLCKQLEMIGEREPKVIKHKIEWIYKAIQMYMLLLCENCRTLKEHTSELLCIADNLDKVSKGTKIAGITGGATTIVGGVAAAAGVIAAPFTAGASLALTTVGVGMAAAGGVTGATAAITNKVNLSQDKKKIDKIFQEYSQVTELIEDCLKFINEGMEKLKQHDLSVLSEARKDSVKMAMVIQLAATGGPSTMALEANSMVSGLIQGFALGMDFYFTKGKKGLRVKKGLESKFAQKIRKLVEDLDNGLEEFMKIKALFSKHCAVK